MAVVESSERHQDLVDELIGDVEAYISDADRELLSRAFHFAARAHEGQQRRSGEDFIQHPFGVAKICAELHLDEEAVAAALLHDVVEDTEMTIDDVRGEFGYDVAHLVEGVTKLTGISFQSREQAEAENYRKMVMAMADDPRVILIKLADRLHNMRTAEYWGRQKQMQKARETLEVYAPLAHRLGIHSVKWELEDLSFERLHPRKYEEIKTMVAERRAEREERVQEAAETAPAGVRRRSTSPPRSPAGAKHFYSIYEKMAKRGREFNEIYDLTAMRVIVQRDGEEGIARLLRRARPHPLALEADARPLQGLHRDAEAERYRALHTTVIGPEGMPLEIQVRTREMHLEAEYGIAAHWVYKRRRGAKIDEGWDGVGQAGHGLAAGGDRPAGVHEDLPHRSLQRGGVRLHAEGRAEDAARPARRRSTSPTPSTPTSATAPSAPR